MRPPVEYNGLTYWPIKKLGCKGCSHYDNGCEEFVKFARSSMSMPKVYSAIGIDTSSVIWQSTDAACLQYITEKLTG